MVLVPLSEYSIFEVIALLPAFLFHFFHAPVFQVQVNPFEGGVGHIVAATLQTKGIIDQASILGQLTSLDMIATFFYLVALSLAIGSVAVFGNYRQGAYLMIGPVFYTFMVTVTTTSDGVKARLGDVEVPNSVERQTAFLEHIKAIGGEINPDTGQNEGRGNAEISLFYATFDGIVTEVMHTLIEFLHDAANIEQQKLIGREKALSFVLAGIPDEYAPVSRLITRHHAECNEVMMGFYTGGKGKANKSIYNARDHGDIEKDLARAEQDFDKHEVILDMKDFQIKRLLKSMDVDGVEPQEIVITNCKEMWGWIGTILETIAGKQLEDETPYGSEEEEEGGDGNRSLEREDVRAWLAESTGVSSEEALAAIMYRNVLENTTHQALESHIYARTPYNQKGFRTTYKDMVTAEARASFLSLKMFMGTIPYLQGLLLYLLSIAFPFFAILLVIPGRALSFLVWCSLWAWVKSWDVGFALVYVARELLWDAFKGKVDMHSTELNWDEPGSVYAFLSMNDPFANQNTYHEIIAFLTISVPFLTAHMFLGATNMFSMFRMSIDQTVGRYRNFQAGAGNRNVATEVNIKRESHREQIGFHAGKAMASLSGGTGARVGETSQGAGPQGGYSPNGYALQTITGRPVRQDRRPEKGPWEVISNKDNYTGVVGVHHNIVANAYDATSNMVVLTNERFLNGLEKSFREYQDLESEVNSGSRSGDQTYHIPGASLSSLFGFVTDAKTGKETDTLRLDTAVPQAIFEHEKHKDKKWIKELGENTSITWREFIKRDMAEINSSSEQANVRLAFAHPLRMLPPLGMKVTDEAIKVLEKDNPLRLRHEASPGEEGKASWREYLIAGYYEQKELYQSFGMAESRPYVPGIQEVSAKIAQNYVDALKIDAHSRIGVVTDENKSLFYTPLGGLILDSFGIREEIERAGLKSDPQGEGTGSAKQPANRGGGDGAGDGA
jgi:hypothetical protein